MTEVAVKEAKNTFTQLLRQVEQGEPVSILRHGKQVAVLTSAEYFQQENEVFSFEKKLNAWRQKAAGIFSNKEIDDIFSTERKVDSPRNPNEMAEIANLWENSK